MRLNQFDFPVRKNQAELHAEVLEKVRTKTPEEGFKDHIKSGVYTPENEVASE